MILEDETTTHKVYVFVPQGQGLKVGRYERTEVRTPERVVDFFWQLLDGWDVGRCQPSVRNELEALYQQLIKGDQK